jgi:hypothetical protein
MILDFRQLHTPVVCILLLYFKLLIYRLQSSNWLLTFVTLVYVGSLLSRAAFGSTIKVDRQVASNINTYGEYLLNLN